jgi:hypothetical protein
MGYQLTEPPNGYDQIVSLLGNPDPYRDQRAQAVWAHRTQVAVRPVVTVEYIGKPLGVLWVHRRLTQAFSEVFKSIAAAGIASVVLEELYSFRPATEDPSKFSIHTFAAAIDLTASDQSALADIFKAHGWTWGGEAEPRHFQFATGY